MLPSIAVIPRDGSFELALFGRMRKFHESLLGLAAGRKSFALKRIEVLVICLVSIIRATIIYDGEHRAIF